VSEEIKFRPLSPSWKSVSSAESKEMLLGYLIPRLHQTKVGISMEKNSHVGAKKAGK